MMNDWQNLVKKHFHIKGVDPKEFKKIHEQTIENFKKN